QFWAAWLRSASYQQTQKQPIDICEDWIKREHPHVRKHKIKNKEQTYVDASDLFKKHTRFADSKQTEGVQLADVCASIGRRFLVDGWRSPYERLNDRVFRDVNRHDVLLIHLDESSLRQGPPTDGVKFLDLSPDAPTEDDDIQPS